MDMIDSFRDGEQFSTFDTCNYVENYLDDSTSLDNLPNFGQNDMYEWNMDVEREINGDIALIPMTVSRLNDSSPNDFQKIMNDWQTFISTDLVSDEFRMEEPIITPEETENEMVQQSNSPLNDYFNLPVDESFDLTSYIVQDESVPPANPTFSSSEKKLKAPVKKIDLKAQRYIVDDDEDEVDVETISENEENLAVHKEENPTVLEACDLNSLLEQFEATVPHLPINIIENDFEPYELPNISIKPEEILMENNITDSGSITMPEIFSVEQLGKIQQVDMIGTELKETEIQTNEQKGSFVAKQEINFEATLQKLEIEGLKEECNYSSIVKVKDEPLCGQENIKNKLKPNKEIVKTERGTSDHHKIPQVNVEGNNPLSETKYIKAEQVKQLNKNHKDNKQSSGKNTLLQISNSGKKTKYDFSCAIPNKTTLSRSLSSAQQNSAQKIHKNPESTTSPSQLDPAGNKQIMDSLPQELIARIKESGKRKTISVIPPMPAKKRGGPRMHDAMMASNKENRNTSRADTVQLDHDYCSLATPYPKHPKKDSGFESAEEDDRPIIGKQPTVKNADGKLMVSLLKVNTIHNNKSTQKKKLNLEEYKKRREGFLKYQNNSQNCSPNTSSCSSPLPEDENTKRIRHQQKLMKMAMEVLNTPPRPEKKAELPLKITPPQPVKVPVDMVKKTLVSVGVNTGIKTRRKKLDPLAPVEQLDEIKPLLQKVSDKINSNSLITSVIENIPKVIDSCDQQELKAEVPVDKFEHGEDKTIVYLPKDRATVQTRSIECQTNISLIQQTKASRYRRRRTSSSSSSSSDSSSESQESQTSNRPSRKRSTESSRSSSQSSRSSRSSHSSASHRSSSSFSSRSSNRSRTRSRSPSPRYSRKERERLLEVEERRVIYVGRITHGTTRDDLRRRFHRFGPITNISLHARDHGYLDNYGFVTFANKLDAYEAIEHGNDDPWQPKYDLSFGGRRIFCQTTYSDLDNMRDESGYFAPRASEDSFDALLKDVQEKLRKRKA
nr:peroxisome proliferator-activated receptor gamma coactivator 1-alpha [Leptinotarsa decemlineata]XP_023024189.1 peroxisome proliferator-activated receptor gamma coactivator 1-alpha [Leptinotarsa decemlineata]